MAAAAVPAGGAAAPAPTPAALARRPRFVLASDLDWTMVDHDDRDHAALREFNALWADRARDALLVFSTGRSHALYEQLRREVPVLGAPDVLICSVGTEVYFESAAAAPVADAAWEAALDAGGWDRAAVAAAAGRVGALRPQPESEQRPHKVSFHLDGGRDAAQAALAALDAELAGLPFATKVIYSGGVDVDVLPAAAGKGAALAFLLAQLADGPGAPPSGALVAGDSGNDVDLFECEGVRGVVVANAHDELRGWAAARKKGGGEAAARVFESGRRGAGAIVEALGHFELV